MLRIASRTTTLHRRRPSLTSSCCALLLCALTAASATGGSKFDESDISRASSETADLARSLTAATVTLPEPDSAARRSPAAKHRQQTAVTVGVLEPSNVKKIFEQINGTLPPARGGLPNKLPIRTTPSSPPEIVTGRDGVFGGVANFGFQFSGFAKDGAGKAGQDGIQLKHKLRPNEVKIFRPPAASDAHQDHRQQQHQFSQSVSVSTAATTSTSTSTTRTTTTTAVGQPEIISTWFTERNAAVRDRPVQDGEPQSLTRRKSPDDLDIRRAGVFPPTVTPSYSVPPDNNGGDGGKLGVTNNNKPMSASSSASSADTGSGHRREPPPLVIPSDQLIDRTGWAGDGNRPVFKLSTTTTTTTTAAPIDGMYPTPSIIWLFTTSPRVKVATATTTTTTTVKPDFTPTLDRTASSQHASSQNGHENGGTSSPSSSHGSSDNEVDDDVVVGSGSFDNKFEATGEPMNFIPGASESFVEMIKSKSPTAASSAAAGAKLTVSSDATATSVIPGSTKSGVLLVRNGVGGSKVFVPSVNIQGSLTVTDENGQTPPLPAAGGGAGDKATTYKREAFTENPWTQQHHVMRTTYDFDGDDDDYVTTRDDDDGDLTDGNNNKQSRVTANELVTSRQKTTATWRPPPSTVESFIGTSTRFSSRPAGIVSLTSKPDVHRPHGLQPATVGSSAPTTRSPFVFTKIVSSDGSPASKTNSFTWVTADDLVTAKTSATPDWATTGAATSTSTLFPTAESTSPTLEKPAGSAGYPSWNRNPIKSSFHEWSAVKKPPTAFWPRRPPQFGPTTEAVNPWLLNWQSSTGSTSAAAAQQHQSSKPPPSGTTTRYPVHWSALNFSSKFNPFLTTRKPSTRPPPPSSATFDSTFDVDTWPMQKITTWAAATSSERNYDAAVTSTTARTLDAHVSPTPTTDADNPTRVSVTWSSIRDPILSSTWLESQQTQKQVSRPVKEPAKPTIISITPEYEEASTSTLLPREPVYENKESSSQSVNKPFGGWSFGPPAHINMNQPSQFWEELLAGNSPFGSATTASSLVTIKYPEVTSPTYSSTEQPAPLPMSSRRPPAADQHYFQGAPFASPSPLSITSSPLNVAATSSAPSQSLYALLSNGPKGPHSTQETQSHVQSQTHASTKRPETLIPTLPFELSNINSLSGGNKYWPAGLKDPRPERDGHKPWGSSGSTGYGRPEVAQSPATPAPPATSTYQPFLLQSTTRPRQQLLQRPYGETYLFTNQTSVQAPGPVGLKVQVEASRPGDSQSPQVIIRKNNTKIVLDSFDKNGQQNPYSSVDLEEDHSVAYVVVNLWNYVNGKLALTGTKHVPLSLFGEMNITDGGSIQPQDMPEKVIDFITQSKHKEVSNEYRSSSTTKTLTTKRHYHTSSRYGPFNLDNIGRPVRQPQGPSLSRYPFDFFNIGPATSPLGWDDQFEIKPLKPESFHHGTANRYPSSTPAPFYASSTRPGAFGGLLSSTARPYNHNNFGLNHAQLLNSFPSSTYSPPVKYHSTTLNPVNRHNPYQHHQPQQFHSTTEKYNSGQRFDYYPPAGQPVSQRPLFQDVKQAASQSFPHRHISDASAQVGFDGQQTANNQALGSNQGSFAGAGGSNQQQQLFNRDQQGFPGFPPPSLPNRSTTPGPINAQTTIDRNELIASLAALNFSSVLLAALAQAQLNETNSTVVSISELVPLLSSPSLTTFSPLFSQDNISIPTLSMPFSVKMINPLKRLPVSVLDSLFGPAGSRNGAEPSATRENVQDLLVEAERGGDLPTLLSRILESGSYEPFLALGEPTSKKEAISSSMLLSRMGQQDRVNNSYEPMLAVNPFVLREGNGTIVKQNETQIKVELLKLFPKDSDEQLAGVASSANKTRQQSKGSGSSSLEGPTLALPPLQPDSLLGEDVQPSRLDAILLDRTGALPPVKSDDASLAEPAPLQGKEAPAVQQRNKSGGPALASGSPSGSPLLTRSGSIQKKPLHQVLPADINLFTNFQNYEPGLSSDKVKLLAPYEPVIATNEHLVPVVETHFNLATPILASGSVKVQHQGAPVNNGQFPQHPSPQQDLLTGEKGKMEEPSQPEASTVQSRVSSKYSSLLNATLKTSSDVGADTPSAKPGVAAGTVFAFKPYSKPEVSAPPPSFKCPDKGGCVSEAEFIGENESPTLRKRINNFFRRVVGRNGDVAAEKKSSDPAPTPGAAASSNVGTKNNAVIAAALTLFPTIALANMGRKRRRRRQVSDGLSEEAEQFLPPKLPAVPGASTKFLRTHRQIRKHF